MLRADVAITDEQKRSICRIAVPPPAGGTVPRRGTGFLVGAGRILTAGHVVQAWNDAKKPYGGAEIEVKFLNPGPGKVPVRVSSVRIEHFDADLDFAVLSFQGNVEGQPFALRRLPPQYAPTWQTFGFSEPSPNGGKEYSGKVSTFDPRRFQLDGMPLSDDPSGLSGSPCIVDGQVCGIILATDRRTSSGTLYAVGVVEVAKAYVPIPFNPLDPPYVVDVMQLLEGCATHLPNAAEKLDIHDAATTIAPESLRRRVAEAMMEEAMMTGEIKKTVNALSQLRRKLAIEDACTVLDLAARTWINHDATVKLRAALIDGKLVILNTGEPRLGKWYTHRASCLKEPHPGDFLSDTLVASAGSSPVFIEAFRKVVAGRIDCDLDDVDAKLARWFDDVEYNPIAIIVPFSNVPKPADVAKIRATPPWEKVGIVFLVTPDVLPRATTDYPEALLLEPPLGDKEGQRAIDRHTAAEMRLQILWKQK
jgi:Trypsin-like peptidase domain